MTKDLVIISEFIKNKLVAMAIDGSLPMDMNELDVDLLMDEAIQTDEYREAKMIENLGGYISEDDVEAAYNKLVQASNEDGNQLADNVVLMWEAVTDKYTVDELLTQIEY